MTQAGRPGIQVRVRDRQSPPMSARSGEPTRMPPSPCPTMGVWAVADGMGGHENGQFASQTLTADIASMGLGRVGWRPNRPVQGSRAARQRHDPSRSRSQRRRDDRHDADRRAGLWPQLSPASGRATAAPICCAAASSRRSAATIPRCRNWSTRGVLTPEQAKTWPRRNVITRAIGIFEDPELDECGGDIRAFRHLPAVQRRPDRASLGRGDLQQGCLPAPAGGVRRPDRGHPRARRLRQCHRHHRTLSRHRAYHPPFTLRDLACSARQVTIVSILLSLPDLASMTTSEPKELSRAASRACNRHACLSDGDGAGAARRRPDPPSLLLQRDHRLPATSASARICASVSVRRM